MKIIMKNQSIIKEMIEMIEEEEESLEAVVEEAAEVIRTEKIEEVLRGRSKSSRLMTMMKRIITKSLNKIMVEKEEEVKEKKKN